MVFSSTSNNKEREESLRKSLISKDDICNKLQNLNIRADERETFINNFNLKVEDTEKITESYKVHTNKENCSAQESDSYKSKNNIVFRNVIFEEEELSEEKFQTCSESESPAIDCSKSNTVIEVKKQLNEDHLKSDLCNETPVNNNLKGDVLGKKEERQLKEEVVEYEKEENDVSEKQVLNNCVSEKQELKDEVSEKQELKDEVSEKQELKDEVLEKKGLKDEVLEKKDSLAVKIKEDAQRRKPEEIEQLENNLCSRGGPDRPHFQRPHEIQNQLHCSRRLHNGGRTIVVSEQSVDQLQHLFQPVHPVNPVNIAIPQQNITPLNIFPEAPPDQSPAVVRSFDNGVVTQPDLDKFARDVTDQHPEIMFLLDIASTNSNLEDKAFHSTAIDRAFNSNIVNEAFNSNQASSAFNFSPVSEGFNSNLTNDTKVNEVSFNAFTGTDCYSSSVCSSSSSSGIVTSNSNISSEGDMSPRSYDKSASPIGSPPMTSHPSPSGASISSSGVSSNGSPQYFVEYYNDSQTYTQAWISSCNQKDGADKQKSYPDILPKPPPCDPPSSPNSVRTKIMKKLHPLYKTRALGMMLSKRDDYFQERDEKDGDTHLMVLLCNKHEYHLEQIYAMVERMVKIPGSLSIKNNAGYSALYIACLKMQHEPLVPAYIAEALLKQNVDVAQLTYKGLTLPKILCLKGDGFEEILKELVAVKNSSGQLIFQSFLSDINGNV